MKKESNSRKLSQPRTRSLRFEQMEERLVLSVSPVLATDFLERIPDIFETSEVFLPEQVEKHKLEHEKFLKEQQAAQAAEELEAWLRENGNSFLENNIALDEIEPARLDYYMYTPKIEWGDIDFDNSENVYTTLDYFPFPSYDWSYLPTTYYPSQNNIDQIIVWDEFGSPLAYPSYNTSVAANYESFTCLNYVRSNYGVTGIGQIIVVIEYGNLCKSCCF